MTPSPATAPPESFASRATGRPWVWVLLIAAIVSVPVVRALRANVPKALPVLGHVPDFTLTRERGEPWGSKQLAGKVWVANFIFSRCPTICPAFTAKMGTIQKRSDGLGNAFALVSFTVDPEHDTPEQLAEYAKSHRAGSRWAFLTGTRAELEAVVVKGLMQPMEKGAPDDLMAIGHGSYFVLVDQKRDIRGFYQFNDEGSVDAVLRDAAMLAAEVQP